MCSRTDTPVTQGLKASEKQFQWLGRNLWEEYPPHQPTPIRVMLAITISNDSDHLRDALTREKKEMYAWPTRVLTY